MFQKIVKLTILAAATFAALPVAAIPGNPSRATVATAAQHPMPLLFTENRGQVADTRGVARPDILFTAQSGSTRLYLTANSIYYQFTKVMCPKGKGVGSAAIGDFKQFQELTKQTKTETYRFSVSLAGANPHPVVRKEEQSGISQNFYLPQCPAGITGVAAYAKLVYENVYPGIDWVLYSNGKTLKYDFIVHPGANPAQIKLKITDAQGATITKEGELLLKTSLGEVSEKAPVSYAGGVAVPTAFQQNSDGTIGFKVAAQPGKELRIDPAVTWASYYGGLDNENVFSIGAAIGSSIMGLAIDGAGNTYSAGTTVSANGIGANGGFQLTYGGSYDTYLAKFDPQGNIMWATYYGGSGLDCLPNCVTDAAGNVYLAGGTNSPTGMSTTGAYQPTLNPGGSDVFLAKFSSAGVRLWGTYYGGEQQENTAYCALDASGNIFLAGVTASLTGIATPGSWQPAAATATSGTHADAFLAKFDATGNRLWGTYYGGGALEAEIQCNTDNSGNVFLTGTTSSATGIASTGSFQPVFGGGTYDAFIAKFDGSGNRQWATYFGGLNNDMGNSCVADATGAIFFAGASSSTSAITTPGAYQVSTAGSADAFLAKFDASGNRIWGTYYGGTGTESSAICTIDNAGNVFLAGGTGSASGIASGGFQNTLAGGNDAFLAKFDTTGAFKWGTYYGGGANDQAYNCLSDGQGSVYMTGLTSSASGIATPGTFQPTYGGSGDAFLVKIADVTIITDTALVGSPFCPGATVSVPFTIDGNFNTGNIFTAQLSDASGSFASPVSIGTLAGTAAGTIAATIPASTPAGTAYRIRVVSSSVPANGTDNHIDLTVNAGGAAMVTDTASTGDTICAGTPVTFTATPTNGGTTPIYQWKKNGTNVGTNAPTYTDNALTNGAVITVVLTSSAACAVPAKDTSTPVIMTVNPNVTPLVSVVQTPSGTICNGVPVTFTATPVNGGAAPVYHWMKNGTSVGTNAPVYTDNAPVNGDVITVSLTSASPCASPATATSAAITLAVGTGTPPFVSIADNAGTTICAGTTVVFTATPVNGGTNPAYQWKKGNTPVGNNSPVYTDNALVSGDVVTVTLTSNNPCFSQAPVASNALTITVNPPATPSISMQVSPDSVICEGTQVTFTTNISNGGSTPIYQWQRNGITVSTSGTYSSNTLYNGDTIRCILGSDIACATTPFDTDQVVMTVNTTTPPAISIHAAPGNIIASGTTVTFTATILNGVPVQQYQWLQNGAPVGTNSPSFTTGNIAEGDTITCTVTANTCSNPDTVISNALVMHLTTGISQAVMPGTVVMLYPNPNSGRFTVEGTFNHAKEATIQVITALGQLVHQEKAAILNNRLHTEIELPTSCTNGTYFLRIATDGKAIAPIQFSLSRQ